MTKGEIYFNILHIITTQHKLKIGSKKFKKQGEAKDKKEITQLHILDTFPPIDSTK